MNKSSVILSEFLSDALPGDDLPAAVRAAIARAFSAVRSHAHRSAARRARGSELIERVRILIKANDAWETELSPIERNVIDVKFGGRSELSNTEVGEALDLTKQMIAYHLNSIARKLEAKFGASAEIKNTSSAAATGSEQGLMRDDRWQATVDWWQARQTDKKELSKEDLEFLSELVERVGGIESGAAKSETAAATAGKPGRRMPPTRYQDLRAKLIENPQLLDKLTTGQKKAMRIGLALGEDVPAPDAELGFRRFDESEKMTKQNFNYMIREVIKRLPAEEINSAD